MIERRWTLAQGFTDTDMLEMLGGERIWWCEVHKAHFDGVDNLCAVAWWMKEHDSAAYADISCVKAEIWLVKP